MLVTLREVLKDAKEKKYGVGLFNTVNLEMTKGVIQAAEELRSPVIIGTAEVLLPYAELEELAYFMVPMAKKASVPVVLHFDHGVTEQRIMEALKLGYTSVMYDCSTDTYENNVKRVADMVKTAETFGASVEAEFWEKQMQKMTAFIPSRSRQRILPSGQMWMRWQWLLERLTERIRKSPDSISEGLRKYPVQ